MNYLPLVNLHERINLIKFMDTFDQLVVVTVMQCL